MITIRDISAAHQEDIEALYLGGTNTAMDILVAVAEQLELWEHRLLQDDADEARANELREAIGMRSHGFVLQKTIHEQIHQAALQIWEAAYQAAGGVVQRET